MPESNVKLVSGLALNQNNKYLKCLICGIYKEESIKNEIRNRRFAQRGKEHIV